MGGVTRRCGVYHLPFCSRVPCARFRHSSSCRAGRAALLLRSSRVNPADSHAGVSLMMPGGGWGAVGDPGCAAGGSVALDGRRSTVDGLMVLPGAASLVCTPFSPPPHRAGPRHESRWGLFWLSVLRRGGWRSRATGLQGAGGLAPGRSAWTAGPGHGSESAPRSKRPSSSAQLDSSGRASPRKAGGHDDRAAQRASRGAEGREPERFERQRGGEVSICAATRFPHACCASCARTARQCDPAARPAPLCL